MCGRTDVETVMKIVKGSKEEGMDRRIYEKKRDASKIVVEVRELH